MKINNYKTLRAYFCISILASLFSSLILPLPSASAKLESIQTDTVSTELVQQTLGRTPVFFEENRGQFNDKVRYAVQGANGYQLFLTATDAVYVLSSRESRVESRESEIEINGRRTPDTGRQATAVYMTLVGANAEAVSTGMLPLEHRTNYFKGAESNWRTDIPNYQNVRMSEVYPGVEMVWQGREQGAVQYDFIVQPNAEPDQIEWQIKGAKAVELTAEGDLVIKTEHGDIKQNKPFTFQDENGFRQEVESRFAVSENAKSFQVKFEIGDYDRSKTLTIDPSVNLSNHAFSTFLGGGGTDSGNGIAVDAAGNIYVAGETQSADFPTTPGGFDTSANGGTDVFVTKLNAAGTNLIYSTYIGGNSFGDYGNAIAVDAAGNAYVTGYSEDGATDYPTTVGAFDTTHNGGFDVFVTKLNPTGSGLVYSTFLGASSQDAANAIVVDSAGNAFVTGYTYSMDGTTTFPTTVGAFDTTHNQSNDVFVTKLNPTGTDLIYSTFIGGTGNDVGRGIRVDSAGNAYLAGNTSDTGAIDYPTTVGAFDTTHNGGTHDAFATKLNAAGTNLIYSTFLGGNGDDYGYALDIDSAGNAYLTGRTPSGGYPTTAGAFDTSYNGGPADVFVTKLNAAGTNLAYSTFLGGTSNIGIASGDESGFGIAVDSEGNAYVTGVTVDAANDYPIAVGAFDATQNGLNDAFFTKLNATGTNLIYSTFLGGSNNNYGEAITVDAAGRAYLTGYTAGEYPVTAGAYDTGSNGGADAFVTKFGGFSTLFDYDGDGRSDISIYRPSNGQWWLNRSTAGVTSHTFGGADDKIVPGDYTGDGRTDVAFWRPSTGFWYIFRSNDSSFLAFPFGVSGDIPAPADFDGDGTTDPAVFRPSNATWYILRSSDNGATTFRFGTTGDVPLPADYDGDGRADIAIYRPSSGQWWLNRSTAGVVAFEFGGAGDKPVPADYTGDGKADVAFWQPSNGNWFVLRSENSTFFAFPFGANGDRPAPGDYDGDGRADVAVFRPSDSTWYISKSTGGTLIQQFGANGDLPTPSAFVP